VPQREIAKMTGAPPPDPTEPSMFGFRDPARIEALLDEAGFDDIVVDTVDIVFEYESLDDWWDAQLEVSATLAGLVGALTPAQRDDLRDAVDAALAEYVAPDGSVALPGRTHVAAASA
jgi:hypothetical protein